jgi:predicted nicotinamide N-methyase
MKMILYKIKKMKKMIKLKMKIKTRIKEVLLKTEKKDQLPETGLNYFL